jgi:hypothetical protein
MKISNRDGHYMTSFYITMDEDKFEILKKNIKRIDKVFTKMKYKTANVDMGDFDEIPNTLVLCMECFGSNGVDNKIDDMRVLAEIVKDYLEKELK